MINVTKTYLPPLEEYIKHLQDIWQRCWITNHGPLVAELEEKLKEYLGVKHLFFVSNGTIALQIAMKALGLKGEIITTPFSYVATTSSIQWEGYTPVFVDIDIETLTINHNLVEEAITANTSAIIATHIYGNPCDVEALDRIAKKHNMNIIYDAAHAFGVKYKDKSLLNYGDISTLSFHATKLFHTAEGGAVITNDDNLAHKISYMRNQGHKGEEDFWGLGINGKSSELHAAMGLCILPKVDKLIMKRKEIAEMYDALLLNKETIKKPVIREGTEYNYAYYAIIFKSEKVLLKVRRALNEAKVFSRRYFYPSLNTIKAFEPNSSMPVSESIAKRVLCLPSYDELSFEEIERIAEIIRKVK